MNKIGIIISHKSIYIFVDRYIRLCKDRREKIREEEKIKKKAKGHIYISKEIPSY
jgi:hypothetical protein